MHFKQTSVRVMAHINLAAFPIQHTEEKKSASEKMRLYQVSY